MLRDRFDAVTPLVDVGAKFLRPCRYDDELDITAEVEVWAAKRFRMRYVFSLAGQVVVTGHEERAWARFDASGKLSAQEVDPVFKDLLSNA